MTELVLPSHCDGRGFCLGGMGIQVLLRLGICSSIKRPRIALMRPMTNDACLSGLCCCLLTLFLFFFPSGILCMCPFPPSLVSLGTVLSWIDIAAGIAAKKHGVYPAVSQHLSCVEGGTGSGLHGVCPKKTIICNGDVRSGNGKNNG